MVPAQTVRVRRSPERQPDRGASPSDATDRLDEGWRWRGSAGTDWMTLGRRDGEGGQP